MRTPQTDDTNLLADLLGNALKRQAGERAKERTELLKHMELIQRSELNYRREMEYKIFTWSNSILILIIGALLITKPSEGVFWLSYGYVGKLVASMAIFVLVLWSVRWQDKNRKLHIGNADVIKRIDFLLHYFEDGYFDTASILPKAWMDYGNEKVDLPTRLGTINYASATAFLGLLTIIMVWVA